jgi:hypothetical protein
MTWARVLAHNRAREHMAPAIDRRTWISLENITRPYYICTTCDNGKTNVFRDNGYPRGFVTWDAGVGIQKIPDATAGSQAGRTGKAKKPAGDHLEMGFGSAL